MDKEHFLKIGNYAINIRAIRWIYKPTDEGNDCLYVCAKQGGCDPKDTYKVCYSKQPSTYSRLLRLFN
jgi:hypothetical protein